MAGQINTPNQYGRERVMDMRVNDIPAIRAPVDKEVAEALQQQQPYGYVFPADSEGNVNFLGATMNEDELLRLMDWSSGGPGVCVAGPTLTDVYPGKNPDGMVVLCEKPVKPEVALERIKTRNGSHDATESSVVDALEEAASRAVSYGLVEKQDSIDSNNTQKLSIPEIKVDSDSIANWICGSAFVGLLLAGFAKVFSKPRTDTVRNTDLRLVEHGRGGGKIRKRDQMSEGLTEYLGEEHFYLSGEDLELVKYTADLVREGHGLVFDAETNQVVIIPGRSTDRIGKAPKGGRFLVLGRGPLRNEYKRFRPDPNDTGWELSWLAEQMHLQSMGQGYFSRDNVLAIVQLDSPVRDGKIPHFRYVAKHGGFLSDDHGGFEVGLTQPEISMNRNIGGSYVGPKRSVRDLWTILTGQEWPDENTIMHL